jgi:hypothetical protein
MSNGNGSAPNRLLWWLVAGILGPIVLAVFSHATTTIYSSAQRITRVEAEQEDAGRRLERIERKLDQLLERREP